MNKYICLTIVAFMFLATYAQEREPSAMQKVIDRFTITGYAQLGWEYHESAEPSNDFKANKLIVMSNLSLTDRWTAFAMFDFKGFSLQELWMAYSVQPWLKVKAGQFKTPFSIENPLSPSLLETIDQTSLATNLMVLGSGVMMPGGAGRDLGVSVMGDAGQWLSYDVAVMNGVGRNKRDDNAWKDFVARLTLHPTKQLDISASTIIGKGATKSLDDDRRAWVWGDREPGKDYTRNRFAVGAYLRTAPLDVRSEWMWGKDGEQHSNGGYVTTAIKNVATDGLDFVASFDHLKTDVTTHRYQAGVQYWFYKKCRLQAGYSYTKASGKSGENAILTQIQVGF